MQDIHRALKQLMDPGNRCGARTMRRGTLWTCVRPKGHEDKDNNGHAAADVTLRYWHVDDTGSLVGTSRVSFRSRLLPREQG